MRLAALDPAKTDDGDVEADVTSAPAQVEPARAASDNAMARLIARVLFVVLCSAFVVCLYCIVLPRKQCVARGLAHYHDHIYLPEHGPWLQSNTTQNASTSAPIAHNNPNASNGSSPSDDNPNASPIPITSQEGVNKERLTRIRETCSHSKASISPAVVFRTAPALYVDTVNKLVICVSLVEMRKVLLSMLIKSHTNYSESNSASDLTDAQTLSGYGIYAPTSSDMNDINTKYNDYYHVIFVSHPNVFYSSSMRRESSPKDSQLLPAQTDTHSVKSQTDTQPLPLQTDTQPVKSQTDTPLVKSQTDTQPLLSQTGVCLPCTVSYAFIGKLETYQQDIASLLTHLHINSSGDTASEYNQLEEVLSTRDAPDASDVTLPKELRIDADMFGYSM